MTNVIEVKKKWVKNKLKADGGDREPASESPRVSAEQIAADKLYGKKEK